ncbi:MAG: ATP phosphoribosyltransferase regulatory subunit, partial [Sphingobium sp.]|nr:ATP phosphoribosyltransferase regulatory subunit [Sphingobium sp.]
RPVADSAPDIDAYLTDEARSFFDKVTSGLDAAGVAWERNARLVRGLDYYRHTAFEFVTDRLGAQGTVLGGGRYDGLIENLGGPATPAVGWAAGIERLAMLVDAPEVERPSIAIIPRSESLEGRAIRATALLRSAGYACSLAFKGNLKRRGELANKAGAVAKLFIGEPDGVGSPLEFSFYNTTLNNQEQDSFVREALEVLGPEFGWQVGTQGWSR